MEAANLRHHGHQPHAPVPPASPTLTNPDMILPDYDRSDSPDPDLDGTGRNHSPLMMWKNAHAAASASDMHLFSVSTPAEQRIDHPYGPTGPITPTTPIIYGNGTMLSDIGEVTEVESTPGKPSPSRNRSIARRLESPTRGSGTDVGLRSSPTMGVAAAMMKKKSGKSLNALKERRSSLESNSTITTQDQAALFADFDDSISVGDSVFQGDDEESMASSYVEGTRVPEPSRLSVTNTDSNDRLSTYSTTSLSRRAEEILANAKKRLTTMEGNLTRARSSLYITPSSYGSDASTPSPPFQRTTTAALPQNSSNSTPSGSPGHSRMSSDIAMRNGLPYRVSIPRSQSALGAAGGYRQPLGLSKSADHIRDGTDDSRRPTYKVTPPRDSILQSLTEDEVARLDDVDGSAHNSRLENFLSPTFGTFSDSGKGLQRSASAAQMRDIKDIKDIKDQMKDLKGKISSLREQARVDSMKRRSLQSLRTPSPFTHAQIDQWYAEPTNRDSTISTGSVILRSPWNGEESSVDGDRKRENSRQVENYAEEDESVYSEVAENRTPLRPASSRSPERTPLPVAEPVSTGQDDDEGGFDVATENGDETDDDLSSAGFQDAVDLGYESESGESLYHDTVQHMISHEDREDAFDYEHFFLHSAMGTIGQQRLRRGSTDSFTSEDSTETTRGPAYVNADAGEHDDAVESPARPGSVNRRNSTASVSTVETFATAEEERVRKSVDTSRGVDLTECIFRDLPKSQKHQPETTEVMKPPSTSTVSRHASMSSIMSAPRENSDGSISSIPEEGTDESQIYSTTRRQSVIRRPISFSTSNSMHRPSMSSISSTGTNRSFPLVNKPKKTNSTGVLTPNDSPDQELKNISDSLMNELGGDGIRDGTEAELANGTAGPQPLQALLREDKYLVSRLVAGLGKCVLGLTESGRASAESRMYRRRIDAARRILEGLEGEEVEA